MYLGNKLCMKKLIVFIFIIALIVCLNFQFTKNLKLSNLFNSANMEVYLSKSCPVEFEYIKNGSGFVFFCDTNDFDEYFSKNIIDGFLIKLSGNDFDDCLKKIDAKIKKNSEFGFYGFSKIFAYNYGYCDEYNFQIICIDDKILLGCPIILGGF